MFVSDSLKNFDTRLQAFSPGIDKGNPSVIDPDGSRSDIGLLIGGTYSYLNLVPSAPVNLKGVVLSNRIEITWNKNPESDTAYYRIYKDTVPGFTIDSTRLLTTFHGTLYNDTRPQGSHKYYYKITCVDKTGLVSLPSNELQVIISGNEEYPEVFRSYELYQNYPNPFNPSTMIRYSLKEGGYVKIMVYTITGELIQVLQNGEKEAGYYEERFDGTNLPSGVYIYRIEALTKNRIPVYSETKKMSLIK